MKTIAPRVLPPPGATVPAVPAPDASVLYPLPPRPPLPQGSWQCDWCGRRRRGQPQVIRHRPGGQRPLITYAPPRDWITLRLVHAGQPLVREYCGAECRARAERYRGRLTQLTDAVGWASQQPGVPPGTHAVLHRFFLELFEVT
jgi:hypothetical protein